MMQDFWWWAFSSRRKERSLEKQQEELEAFRQKILTIIADYRSRVEEMAQRPRHEGDRLNIEILESVRERMTAIEDAAKLATSKDALRYLEESADEQETFRAYLCPSNEIRIEGNLVIALIAWWGIPRTEIDSLRGSLVRELEKADQNPDEARFALRALYKERDEWGDYREDYESTMQMFARWLFGAAIVLPLFSMVAFHFAFLWLPLLIAGLFMAGGAGSCVSVITKLPALEGSRSEKIDSYERRIWSRISAGAIASLIGCGLLGWGLIPISVNGRTFADVLNGNVPCLSGCTATCVALRILILLAVPMLFGFSERALTSFEHGFLGNSKKS